MADTIVSRKLKSKFTNGQGKNGKDLYSTISLARVKEGITKENALRVGDLIGAIVGKPLVAVTKVTEEEYSK